MSAKPDAEHVPKRFPKGFLWGASTSSHQVEGGNHNDWTEWEKRHAEQLAAKAEREFANVVPDWEYIKEAATDPKNYISGRGVDHYHRYEEDLKLAQSLGLTSFRLSIEWSRIEPEKGQFNQAAIEHYRKVIRATREHGMEPFVTLWHWTLPAWVARIGGWHRAVTGHYFTGYVEKVVDSLGDDVTFWVTLNEPEVYTDFAHLEGDWPPMHRSLLDANRVLKRLSRAHKRSYKIIKARYPAAQVGIAKHNISIAIDRSGLNFFLKLLLDQFWNLYFLRLVLGYQDYIGINYYFHNRTRFSTRRSVDAKFSDMGWELYPEGLLQVLRGVARYNLPIYITENGLADGRDVHRGAYIQEVVAVVWQAMQEGIDIRGYSYWSLLDNFEWDKGFWPRFGLIEVDYRTGKRRVRDGAKAYAKIIKDGGIDLED